MSRGKTRRVCHSGAPIDLVRTARYTSLIARCSCSRGHRLRAGDQVMSTRTGRRLRSPGGTDAVGYLANEDHALVKPRLRTRSWGHQLRGRYPTRLLNARAGPVSRLAASDAVRHDSA